MKHKSRKQKEQLRQRQEQERREDLEDLLLTFEVDPRIYLRNFYRDLLAK